ncbi:hypothetical protein DMA15_15545 [Streptomyces sp. WAC 01529]|nr:hypothetical protein DMA15_15545 [Streptomyces sp. WAC 01529]
MKACAQQPESTACAPVVVHPASPTGGLRVWVRGQILGLAHCDADVIKFLRRAGLPGRRSRGGGRVGEVNPRDRAATPPRPSPCRSRPRRPSHGRWSAVPACRTGCPGCRRAPRRPGR